MLNLALFVHTVNYVNCDNSNSIIYFVVYVVKVDYLPRYT